MFKVPLGLISSIFFTKITKVSTLTGELDLNLLYFGKKEIEIFPRKLDFSSEKCRVQTFRSKFSIHEANPSIYKGGLAYTRSSYT